MKKTFRTMLVAAMAMLTMTYVGCKGGQGEGEGEGEGGEVKTTEMPDTMTIKVGDSEFSMSKVEPGTFTIGPVAGDKNVTPEEKPAHKVDLTQRFYIGQTEVTQDLYQAVMGTNPSNFKGAKNLPVEQVSYNDAIEFCKRLSEKTGHTFTLPTEAQWEYAARGGQKAPTEPQLYAGSNNIGDVTWFEDNSGEKTHPVASKAPNAIGLYDMTGNVFEWCLDWYGSYKGGDVTNPEGPASGKDRVIRGGSWRGDAKNCRVSYRYNYGPDHNRFNLGFRVVMLPE